MNSPCQSQVGDGLQDGVEGKHNPVHHPSYLKGHRCEKTTDDCSLTERNPAEQHSGKALVLTKKVNAIEFYYEKAEQKLECQD